MKGPVLAGRGEPPEHRRRRCQGTPDSGSYPENRRIRSGPATRSASSRTLVLPIPGSPTSSSAPTRRPRLEAAIRAPIAATSSVRPTNARATPSGYARAQSRPIRGGAASCTSSVAARGETISRVDATSAARVDCAAVEQVARLPYRRRKARWCR
jgi:hypothetical protein